MAVPAGHSDAAWGKKISDCGHAALNVIFGINQDTFNTCLMGKVSISSKCSSCYAQMAEYDFQHCKFKCLFSWCSQACIECNKGSDLISCIGFVDPQPTVCDGSGGDDGTQSQGGVGLPGGDDSSGFGVVPALVGILVALSFMMLAVKSCLRHKSHHEDLRAKLRELQPESSLLEKPLVTGSD